MSNLYFNLKPPVPGKEASTQGESVPQVDDAKPLTLIRTKQTGDKVYRVLNGKAHWVMSPEVLNAIGGDFADVDDLPGDIFTQIEKAEPINMSNYKNFVIEKNED